MRWRPVALVLVLAFSAPAAAEGQELWGAVTIPGGVAAARRTLALQASPDRADELLLLDFADRYAALRNRPAVDLAERYFRVLAAVADVMDATPEGCGLPAVGPGQDNGDGASDRACLASLGLNVRERQGRLVAELDTSGQARERRDWLATAGVDAATIAADVNAGGRARVRLDVSTVPLPLPEFWRREAAGQPLAAAITGREEMALLYRALLSLDDETLAHLAARPALVRRLAEEAPRTFAVFGRSIRVQDGLVQVPGGEHGVETWQRLVGRPVADVEGFVLSLLRTDNGRLVYFYDAVARLDAVRRAAALGQDAGGTPRPDHADHVDRVYRRFRDFDQFWDAREQSFQLRAFDPPMALALVAFGPEGAIGPDWWPSLLERITGDGSWPDRPEQTMRRLRSTRADAAWVLEWLFDDDADAQRRFTLLRYLQRQFPRAPRDDAPVIELALRTHYEEPALALSLERMGVRDAALIGELGRQTRDLTAGGVSDHVLQALGRWQSAFGWLEQIHRHRPMAPEVLADLLGSLAEATPRRADDDSGGVPSWIVEQLLPRLGAGGDRSEAGMFEILLGAPDAPEARVRWEGLEYRVQPHLPVLRAVDGIRAAQPGPRLDDLVALQQVRRALEAGPESLDAVTAIVDVLDGRAPAVRLAAERGLIDNDVVSDLERVSRDLSRIQRERDLERAGRDVRRLIRVIDRVADVLLSQALYAMAAAPTTSPPELFADGWRRHELAERLADDFRPWTRLVWDAARSSPDLRGNASIHGSFLALDVALADARLRDVASGELLAPPMLAGPDRQAMVQSLTLARPAEADLAAEGRVLAAALAEGRRRVERWMTAPPPRADLRAALDDAAVGPSRANLILWTAERQPARLPAWLTLTELHSLGGGGTIPATWGVASRTVDGCLCFQPFDAWTGPWLRDRPGSGLAGSAVTDLSLGLAEHLDAMELPATLAPLLAGAAMREWIDRVWQLVPSDAAALADFPATLSLLRLEDYLLALVADRVMVVIEGAGR